MKNLFFIAIILLSNYSAFPQAADTSSYISLKPPEFHEELKIVFNPVVADVREVFEYRHSRLPGAVNIPSSGSLEIFADTVDKARHIFVYCTTDFRSKQAARKLAGKGFIHVYNLDGGIKLWRKQGYPVDRKRVRKE